MMLGIVIVSYKSDDRTVSFVLNELPKISVPYVTVVVDNGADKGEASVLQARLKGLATVLPAENGGYARGNNLGARWLAEMVHPDYFLFTNNDIRLDTGAAVSAPLIRLREHPDVGAAGPEIIGPDGRRQSPEPYEKLWTRYVWKYLSTPFLPKALKRKLFRLDYANQAGEGYHYRLMGAFLLVDAEAFFQAGLFDEATFLYGEEYILSERLLRIGKKCWFCPYGTVFHEHGAVISSHLTRTWARLMDFDSMAYYYRTYRGYSRLSVSLARLLYRAILRLK